MSNRDGTVPHWTLPPDSPMWKVVKVRCSKERCVRPGKQNANLGKPVVGDSGWSFFQLSERVQLALVYVAVPSLCIAALAICWVRKAPPVHIEDPSLVHDTLDDYQKNLDEMRKTLDLARRRLEKSQAQATYWQVINAKNATRLESREVEIHRLSAETDDLRRRLRHFRDELQVVQQREIRRLEEEVDRLKARQAELLQTLASAQSEAERTIAELQAENDRLQSELDYLQRYGDGAKRSRHRSPVGFLRTQALILEQALPYEADRTERLQTARNAVESWCRVLNHPDCSDRDRADAIRFFRRCLSWTSLPRDLRQRLRLLVNTYATEVESVQ